ncbi:GNAT family N-acetyltransferase [Peribacillus sp. SCS-155]|uniref:GNAT family N-acetyltransferase n=1 Tax=Peribacillus sedimenti TaxID=3115297 RepID=UPI00390686C9
MEYLRITTIDDPLFRQLHNLMKTVFPQEEVLKFDLWKEPLEDPAIRVFVALHENEVVGATEYRFYPNLNIAMTDFTIVGVAGLGIGRFLSQNRQRDLDNLAYQNGKELFGMFAEIYNPYVLDHNINHFGGVQTMNPYVRREVLSHLGYKRLDFPYIHPSWQNDGEAVEGLDLCFMPKQDKINEIPSALIVEFLSTYYQVLSEKPNRWLEMIENLKHTKIIQLLPL